MEGIARQDRFPGIREPTHLANALPKRVRRCSLGRFGFVAAHSPKGKNEDHPPDGLQPHLDELFDTIRSERYDIVAQRKVIAHVLNPSCQIGTTLGNKKSTFRLDYDCLSELSDPPLFRQGAVELR